MLMITPLRPPEGSQGAVLELWKATSNLFAAQKGSEIKTWPESLHLPRWGQHLENPKLESCLFSACYGWRNRKNSTGREGSFAGNVICEFVTEAGTSVQAPGTPTPIVLV